MKKYLLFIFLLCLIKTSFTQNEWAPVGAKWYYNDATYFPFNNPYILTCLKDTIINGNTCKKMQINNNMTNYNYLYENNNRIFQYNSNINQFTVLYDFNKNVGETWNIITNSIIDTFSVIVDSINYLTINNDSFKVQYISSQDMLWDFNGLTIEKIGNITFMFPQYGLADFHIGPLRCYEDSNIVYNRTNYSCDTSFIYTDVRDMIFKNKIIIYPNPCTNYFTINLISNIQNYLNYILFNQVGLKIKEDYVYNNEILVDISDLPKGIYILKLKLDKYFLTKKIIKL